MPDHKTRYLWRLRAHAFNLLAEGGGTHDQAGVNPAELARRRAARRTLNRVARELVAPRPMAQAKVARLLGAERGRDAA